MYDDPADYPFAAPLGQPATHEQRAAQWQARQEMPARLAALEAERDQLRALLGEWLTDFTDALCKRSEAWPGDCYEHPDFAWPCRVDRTRAALDG